MANDDNYIHISTRIRRKISSLLRTLYKQRVSHREAYATWSTIEGGLYLGPAGYKTLSQVVVCLQEIPAVATYPTEHLSTVVAHAVISQPDDVELAVARINERLGNDYGEQRALVPFWGFHIEPDVRLEFGPYCLQRLGDSGFDAEILNPLRHIRANVGDEQMASDLAKVAKDLQYMPNVPVMTMDYRGAGEGAKDFVGPVAERVSEFLQFFVAPLVDDRTLVKIIDHRGAYFGRFSTFMPVISRNNEQPHRLQNPNIQRFPYSPTLSAKQVDYYRECGLIDLLPAVPKGPSRGESATAMLLRAIQLFSDGERSVSIRQAVVAYVGACDALFGHAKHSELYTCAGMAAAAERDFDVAYQEAQDLYEARSVAAHQGITPDSIGLSRHFAYQSIRYVASHKHELKNKVAIRQWILPFVERALQIKSSR